MNYQNYYFTYCFPKGTPLNWQRVAQKLIFDKAYLPHSDQSQRVEVIRLNPQVPGETMERSLISRLQRK